ncbi:hypothetical protein AB205_0142380, partial [Aquarana catesbeiana]
GSFRCTLCRGRTTLTVNTAALPTVLIGSEEHHQFSSGSFRCTLCRGRTTLTLNTAAACGTNRIRRTLPIFFR